MDEALIITGSLNAKMEDRFMDREQVIPFQVLINGEIKKAVSLSKIGELGISSLAFPEADQNEVYIVPAPGVAILKLDIRTGRISRIPCSELEDVHEIEFINGTLWVSNTGYDEVLAINVNTQTVERRINLYDLKEPFQKNRADRSGDSSSILVDKYHCNQVFADYEGKLFCLVHHVWGRQVLHQVTSKLKKQGDGGIINLETGERIPLGLKAPHSVRKVNGNYWVFDSGNATINIYNKSWGLIDRIQTRGWGRGAAVSDKYFYAGISATRKRYLGIIPRSQQAPNMIQVFSTHTKTIVDEVLLFNIEQVNNLYLVNVSLAERILDLTEVEFTDGSGIV
ncbi:DUF4915 domain-containing protein [Desulfofundulus thermosubterraneus]|uniref:Conserved hypothetical protein CHP03032 domain-containing protein n=1 Tax=Desulfofundulus thermosubterraneus DSM 16057 TaxID=1121432 RepID=A0A1M6MQ88_9FIRM|nr:DUF4915 domain-containing protein [Desulfofundulus thermosubterraneus]SHJ85566.1 protein of unknown function [Desulfofundulus thermosubterraneus DSM 16057]